MRWGEPFTSNCPGTTPRVPRQLLVADLGRCGYREVLELQRSVALGRRGRATEDDVLLLVEHEPVFTLGRGANPQDPPGIMPGSARVPDVVEIERGGDITYHGPGQLVGYPILDLHAHRLDLHWYLRQLEGVLLRTLAAYRLPGYRVEGFTGAWTGNPPPDLGSEKEGDGYLTISQRDAGPMVSTGVLRKVASIGVHASRWITWHGFAFNVTREPLEAFANIVPCGIPGVAMTSLESEGAEANVNDAAQVVVEAFGKVFPGLTHRYVPSSSLVETPNEVGVE